MPSAKQESDDRKDRLYNLYQELQDAEADKKTAVKSYNENINRIKEEMKSVIVEEDADTVRSQKDDR